MRPSHDQRFRYVMAFLALAAVAILLGLGTHGHHDQCHDYCWTCHSSLGAIGLPAISFILILLWVYRAGTPALIRALHAFDVNPHAAPRAPPSDSQLIVR